MKFFVDTADTAEIKSLASSGLLDGVTTNPSLVAKTGRKFLDVLADICAVVPGPVSAEVAATDFDGMMAEARVVRSVANNIAVKVPLTPDGLRACRRLTDDGAMVNVTLCFSAAQAILAAKAGATFVSPFVGRLDDIGDARHGADRRHRADLSATTRPSRPRSWSPRCAARCTWSRPARSAPISPRCRPRYCARCSTIR